MGDGDGVSGWQGAATPRAIIAASVAVALTSRPQGRPKGLSSAVVLGSAAGVPGSGRGLAGLKAAGRMASAASRWQAQVGRRSGAAAKPDVSGRSWVSACTKASGGLRRIGRLQNGGEGRGGLRPGGAGATLERSGRAPVATAVPDPLSSRAGHRPAPRKAPLRRPSGQAHRHASPFLLRHDDRTSAM
jgi:hypothetical protein